MSYILPDPRFEMPELLTPRRKPTGLVQIDWTNTITKNIGHFFICNPNQMGCLVTKELPTGMAGNWEATQFGYGWRTDADGDYIQYANHQNHHFSFSSGFTLWWRGYIYGEVAGISGFYSSREGSLSNGEWCFYTNGEDVFDEVVFQLRNQSTAQSTVPLGGSTWPAVHPDLYDLYLTHEPTGVFKLYQYHVDSLTEGSVTDTSASPFTNGSTAPFVINDISTSFGRALDAVFLSGAVWQRKLEDQEVYSLHRDPYQFLIPA